MYVYIVFYTLSVKYKIFLLNTFAYTLTPMQYPINKKYIKTGKIQVFLFFTFIT